MASVSKWHIGLHLRAAREAALDLLYPRRCAACGRADPDAGRFLCWDCRSALQLIKPPYCRRCGDPVAGRIDHEYTCASCSARAPAFVLARSAARFQEPLDTFIHQLKYRGATWLADDLAALLEGVVQTHYPDVRFDAAAAVPLYPPHQRERGYNQARLLAQALGRRLRLPLLRATLFRATFRQSQTRLTALQRADNVRGVFAVRERRWLNGRRILLVDDVMTTGATVRECARVLADAGAAGVWVATVARG